MNNGKQYIVKKINVEFDDKNCKKILLYFEPDLDFMKLCRENGFKLLCHLPLLNIKVFCNISQSIDYLFYIASINSLSEIDLRKIHDREAAATIGGDLDFGEAGRRAVGLAASFGGDREAAATIGGDLGQAASFGGEEIKSDPHKDLSIHFYPIDTIIKDEISKNNTIENFSLDDAFDYSKDSSGKKTLIWNKKSIMIIIFFSFLIILFIFFLIIFILNNIKDSSVGRHG